MLDVAIGCRRCARALLALWVCIPSLALADVTVSSQNDATDILQRANRSTVRIIASRESGRRTQRSFGAGVVVSEYGYVVTAHHVVNHYPSVRITTQSGTTHSADLVCAAPEIDIALLKVRQPRQLEPASLASPDRIHPGRRALVIGNPLGEGQKIIPGKLGTTRTVTWDGKRAELRVVQAPVVPGDSGGGTFDCDTGELLGITVAKSSTHHNTGYLVPADRLAIVLSEHTNILELASTQANPESLSVRSRTSPRTTSILHSQPQLTQVLPANRTE